MLAELLLLTLARAACRAAQDGGMEPAAARREEALAAAHEGAAAESDFAGCLARARAAGDPITAGLWAAALLVPERVSGRPPAAGVQRQEALDLVTAAVVHGPDASEVDVLFERLRGATGAAEAERIGAALQHGAAANRLSALSLLIAAPFPAAREVMTRLALDPRLPLEERARLVERLLLGAGPAALAELEELLAPGADAQLARRVLVAWQSFLQPEDLPRLARLAVDGPDGVREYALQIWARYEQDPAQRLRIFELLWNAAPDLRQVGLAALASGGRHAAIGRHLLDLLDSADRNSWALAMQFLPAFVEAEELFEAYRARIRPEDDLLRRGYWIKELAPLPLPAAKDAAAAWLADGGFACGSLGSAVARALHGAPELDPYLDRLLLREQPPVDWALPLAAARCSSSPAARLYLRRVLDEAGGLAREQAVRALAAAAYPEDLELVLAVAQDFQFDPGARAAAVAGLARDPRSRGALRDFYSEPLPEYEVLDALVRASIASGEEALRQQALELADSATAAALDGDERRGLRLAAWEAQEQAPRAQEWERLDRELERWVRATPPLSQENAALWDPRRLAAEYAEVHVCARALRAALRAAREQGRETAAGAWLAELAEPEIVCGALMVAAAQLADEEPRMFAGVCRSLAQCESLPDSTRLRARAAWARAAMRLGPEPTLEALAALLTRPREMREYPWDLEWGLGIPGTRGWVLPMDRLAEKRLLAEAQLRGGRERLVALESLLLSYTAPGHLLDATELAIETPGGATLALRLAERAAAFSPLDVEPRWAIARAAAAARAPEERRAALQAVLWLAPRGSSFHEAAQRELRSLAGE